MFLIFSRTTIQMYVGDNLSQLILPQNCDLSHESSINEKILCCAHSINFKFNVPQDCTSLFELSSCWKFRASSYNPPSRNNNDAKRRTEPKPSVVVYLKCDLIARSLVPVMPPIVACAPPSHNSTAKSRARPISRCDNGLAALLHYAMPKCPWNRLTHKNYVSYNPCSHNW